MGIQIAGREINQKRKKHIKSRVFVPDDAGIEFAEGAVSMAIDLSHFLKLLTNVFYARPHGP